MGLIKSFWYYDELVDLLEGKGLVIEDREVAKKVLSEVNYYRLINAYALGLYEDNKKEKFKSGVTFHQIHSLYLFDVIIRHVVSELLEMFEIMFRAKIVNFIGDKYGALGYLKSENFENAEYHREFIDKFNTEKQVQTRSPIVKHHAEEYEGNLPIWAAVEIVTFGTLSKLYKNMKKEDKTLFAKEFGTTNFYLESWLASFVEMRNICAHYGRLYNKLLLFRPKRYDGDKYIVPNRLFVVLFYLKRFSDEMTWRSMMIRIENAMALYPNVDLRCIGFPLNWQALLDTGMYKKPDVYTYPLILSYDGDDNVSGAFPVFDIQVTGKNDDEVICEAKKSLGKELISREKKCKAIPVPLKLSSVKIQDNQKVISIDIDMLYFRQKKKE